MLTQTQFDMIKRWFELHQKYCNETINEQELKEFLDMSVIVR